MTRPAAVLTFDRVELRRWRADDADTVHRLVTESLEHLLPWMPFAAVHSRDGAATYVTQSEHQWESGDSYNYAVISDGHVIGSCGLMRRIGPGGLEIGYWLHPAWTGRGLATMAVAALVHQAFALPEVDRVEIVHDEANHASAAIPRRLGFTRVERRTAQDGPAAPAETGVEIVWRLLRPPTDRDVLSAPATRPAELAKTAAPGGSC